MKRIAVLLATLLSGGAWADMTCTVVSASLTATGSTVTLNCPDPAVPAPTPAPSVGAVPWLIYPSSPVDYIYPSDLDKGVARVGNWNANAFPFSGYDQFGVVSNWGAASIFAYSKSSLDPNPQDGNMNTFAVYAVGEHDSTSGKTLVAGGAYIEGRGGAAPGVVSALETSIQNTCTSAPCLPSNPTPYQEFPPVGRHLFGQIMSTSGTKWPYAANDVSAGWIVVASSPQARFNKGIVFIDGAIRQQLDGHKEAIAFAQSDELVWYGPDGQRLYLTSDGNSLFVYAGSKKYKVSLTAAPALTRKTSAAKKRPEPVFVPNPKLRRAMVLPK